MAASAFESSVGAAPSESASTVEVGDVAASALESSVGVPPS